MDDKCKGCFDRDAIFHKGMKRGVELMLEKAIGGIVNCEIGTAASVDKEGTILTDRFPLRGLKIGDKVKIVVIREDEGERV